MPRSPATWCRRSSTGGGCPTGSNAGCTSRCWPRSRRGAGPVGALATGSVHRYLGYGFYALCGLLILLVVTR